MGAESKDIKGDCQPPCDVIDSDRSVLILIDLLSSKFVNYLKGFLSRWNYDQRFTWIESKLLRLDTWNNSGFGEPFPQAAEDACASSRSTARNGIDSREHRYYRLRVRPIDDVARRTKIQEDILETTLCRRSTSAM